MNEKPGLVAREIEDEDACVAAGGTLEHLGMAERMHHIAIAGEPTLLNGLAGEFVLFGRTFGTLAPLRNVPNREADSRSKLAVRLFATMILSPDAGWGNHRSIDYRHRKIGRARR